MEEDDRRSKTRLNSRRSQKVEPDQEDEATKSTRKRVIPQYKAVTLPEGLSGQTTGLTDDKKSVSSLSKSIPKNDSREEKPDTPAEDSDDEERQRRKREIKELSVWKRFSLPAVSEIGLSNSNPDGLKRRSLADRFSHKEVMDMLNSFKREQEEIEKQQKEAQKQKEPQKKSETGPQKQDPHTKKDSDSKQGDTVGSPKTMSAVGTK